MTGAETGPVVLVGDAGAGTEVRWFRSLEQAAYPGSAVVIANQSGVVVRGYVTDVPDAWLAAAVAVHRRLAADPAADVSDAATHRHRAAPNGPLEPVPGRRRG